MNERVLEDFSLKAIASLKKHDPTLVDLLLREYERQTGSLTMVASCTITHPECSCLRRNLYQ